MKKMYKLKQSLKLLAMVIIVGWTGSAFAAGLTGAYTIDNTAATGGTNFNTFLDFNTSIVANGVSGPVTVTFLTNQTESTLISFPSTITGISSTNTVVIDGNSKFFSMSMSSELITMNGADYFTFKNLTLRNTSSSTTVQGIRFYNGADNNTVNNCIIEFTALASASTLGGAYISFASSSTSLSTTSSTNNGAKNTISNNLMRTTNSNSPGPTYGIVLTESSSTYSSTAQNNTISGNTIQNFYSYGVYLYYTNGAQILNNNISRANSSSNNGNSTLTGVYSYYAYSTGRSFKIDGNNLHDWPYAGCSVSSANNYNYAFSSYYAYGASNTSNRVSISNNTIQNINTYYSLYIGNIYYNTYVDINGNVADNNDLSVGNSSSYQYGWNVYYTTAYNINNNVIKNCDGGYYWHGIYVYQPGNVSGVETNINGNNISNCVSAGYLFQGIQAMYIYNTATNYLNVNDNIVDKNQAYGYYMVAISIGDPIYYGYSSYGHVNIQRNKITRNTSNPSYGYVYALCTYYGYNENITDNMIADNVGYYQQMSMYLYNPNSGYTANIRQSTIKVDGSQSSYTYQYVYGIYNYEYNGTCYQEGNIIDIEKVYYAYMFYAYHPNTASLYIKNNSYYDVGTLNMQYYSSGGSGTSFAGWNATGIGINEKYGDPKWNNASTLDLRSNTLMNQNNVPYNALDIKDANQVLRNTSANDRGSLEGYLDIASVSSTFAPNTNECAGYTASPTVTLKNNFIDKITGFNLGLSINGVLASTATVTNTINVGATGTVTFNPVKFSKAGLTKVKIFLLNADDNPVNDTLAYSFTIKQAPGGGVISLNTTLSAPKAVFDITGKPDITTNGQKIVYNMTAPSRVGYTNAENLFNGGSKWFLNVSGVTKYGIAVPTTLLGVTNPNGTTDGYVTFNPSLALVDSLITITFKVVDVATGCDTIYKRNVQVAPQGIPDFKLPSIICDKDEVFFENTSSVTSGALLSTWDFGDGSPTVDATSPVYKYNGPGTYTVKLTVVTSPYGYVSSKSVVINVNEIPTANFKPTNACAGTAIKLTNMTTIGSGTLSYVWDFGDGSPTSTAVNTSKLYPTPGGYKVTLAASGNGCINKITKNVYQFARPVASFTKVAGSCENDIFEFKNNSTISLGEFGNNWDFNDGGNKATVSDPKYDFVTSGNKKVKLKVVSEFGCIDSMETTILVKTIATTKFTAPFACSRTATQFTNTTNLHGESVQSLAWDFGDGYTSTATSPLHSWSSIGPKIVSLTTNLVNGCSDQYTEILNVGVQPLVNFQFADQCAGVEVQFTNLTSFTQGNIIYAWDFGDQSGSVEGSPKHYYSTGVGTQTFTVVLRARVVGGCSDSSVQTININPKPTTCDFDMARDYSTSLTAYKFTPKGGSLSGIDYTWLTGDGGTVNSVGAGATYVYANSGKYCVTMIAKNTSGCECTRTNCVALSLDVNSAASMNNLVSIFPNPTNGIFNVKLDANINNNMVINVYNAIGSLVKTITVDSNNANVDLTGFANGVYMVKVIADNQIATKQIVLNK